MKFHIRAGFENGLVLCSSIVHSPSTALPLIAGKLARIAAKAISNKGGQGRPVVLVQIGVCLSSTA